MTTQEGAYILLAFIVGMIIGVKIEREDAKERVQETSKIKQD